MKLKTRLNSLDELNALPESYRTFYTQSEDGKSWALADEFEIEDTTGLKSNHEKLLKQHKAAQDELKKAKEELQSLNPDKAREAMKKLEELENKSLMDEGKFEELFTKRTEAMKREHQAQLDAASKALKEREDRVGTLEKELQRTVISSDLTREAGPLRIKPEFLPFLQLAAQKDWELNEDGKPVWKVDGQVRYGKDPTKLANMIDYLTDHITKTPSLVEGSHGNGSNGNTSRGTPMLSISRRDLQDSRKYEEIKAQAAKQGIPLSQVEVTE